MSVLVQDSLQDPTTTMGSGLLTMFGSLTLFGQGTGKPKVNDAWIHDPNYYSWQNLSSGYAYSGIKAVQPNDVVNYPGVPSLPLSANSADDLFQTTAEGSQTKIGTYFGSLDSKPGWIDQFAGVVNDPTSLVNDPFGFKGTINPILAIVGVGIVGYLFIK